MPAIWRTCWGLPLAPESTIMSSGLKGILRRLSSMALPTSELAVVQISISFWRRSSSVMMPRLNWFSALSASFWRASMMAAFSAGTLTSSIEMVRPDWVA